MRVISGKYKGKKLIGFDKEGPRPTKDRVKESVFAMIQNKLRDSIFLDLFAGSGSIGIEALSNGASKCYFVDNGKQIIKLLNENLNNIDNAVVINNSFLYALNYFKDNNITFDIIFLDPPYHLNLLNDALKYIEKYNLLKNDGLIICEYEEEVPLDIYDVIAIKKYGKTNIKVLRK